MTYTQYLSCGRYVIRVVTRGGYIYYGYSAHELTDDEIRANWRDYKRNPLYWSKA